MNIVKLVKFLGTCYTLLKNNDGKYSFNKIIFFLLFVIASIVMYKFGIPIDEVVNMFNDI